MAPIPGTLVVNAGDLIQRWTNDRWISNVHRVANPPPDRRSGVLMAFHRAVHRAKFGRGDCLSAGMLRRSGHGGRKHPADPRSSFIPKNEMRQTYGSQTS